MESPLWISNTITRLRASPTNLVKLVAVLTIATIAITRIHTLRHKTDGFTDDNNGWGLMPWLFEARNGNATTDILDNSKNQEWKLLFVGNSYTEVNDLPSLVRHMFQEQWNARVLVKSHHPGGETFRGHYASTRSDYRPPPDVPYSDTYTELRKWLVSKPRPWNWVIFQEQSQVPGFWDVPGIPSDYSFNVSLHNSQQLNRLVERLPHSQTMFYMTWGRRNGDDYNRALYPDYPTMQARITQGYKHYQQATSREGRPTYMAPVGLVFDNIYQQCLDHKGKVYGDNNNPGTDQDSLFYQLYAEDGSHPSLAGSYLAALTIYTSILGDDPRDVHWTPPGLPSSIALQIRQAVAKTILETASNEWMNYPWQQDQSVPSEEEDIDDINGVLPKQDAAQETNAAEMVP